PRPRPQREMAALVLRAARRAGPAADPERRQFCAATISRRLRSERGCRLRLPAIARHLDPQDGRLRAAATSADHDRHRRRDGNGRHGDCRIHASTMSGKLFDKVALIGIGLIGSSLARVLRRDAPDTKIVACARRPETLDTVRRLNLADLATGDPAEAVQGADLVVIATPLPACAEVAHRIAPALKPGAIVTDVGSVKEAAIRELHPLLPATVHFVPGHPVAGTEHSGPESGFAELFHDRWCILTPPPETAP